MEKYWVIADIHGEYQKLLTLMELIKKHGFNLETDRLVSLGDKNDRGPDTYEVFEYFRNLDLMYPDRVDLIWGNHEDMMMNAAKLRPHGDIFWFNGNGGTKTLESYSKVTRFYGKKSLGNSLIKTGHHGLFHKHIYFLETPEYFFCHAPIPKEQYRHHAPGVDFRCDINTLIWGAPERDSWNKPGQTLEEWIEPNLIPIEENGNFSGKHKLCVYGHLHRLEWKEIVKTHRPATNDGHEYKIKGYEVVNPGVQKIGNAVLLDTGCGCALEGYLSCLELPAMKVYDSRGEVFDLK